MKRITAFLVAALTLIATPDIVRADIGAARTALFAGDPAVATRMATGGDLAAQLALGEAYLTGRGVAKDPTKAALWIVVKARSRRVRIVSQAGTTHDTHGNGVGTHPVRRKFERQTAR